MSLYKKYNNNEKRRNCMMEKMGLEQYPLQMGIIEKGEENKYVLRIIGIEGELIVPYFGGY